MGQPYVAYKRNFIDDAASKRFTDILKTIRYRSEDKSMRSRRAFGLHSVLCTNGFDKSETLLNGFPRTHPDLMLLNEAGLFSTHSNGTCIIMVQLGPSLRVVITIFMFRSHGVS